MSSKIASRILAGVMIGAMSVGGAFAQAPLQSVEIIIPTAPGGGFDVTGRAFQQAMVEAGVVGNAQAVNRAGAGGMIGLAATVDARPDQMLSGGLVLIGTAMLQNSPVTVDNLTPLARLHGEYNVLVVTADSPYQSLGDAVEAFKADPGSVTWGGGGAGGGDHIFVAQIAAAVGVPTDQLNYISHQGGGEVLASLLSGDVKVATSGLAEFAGQIEAGELRALAISAPERVEGIEIPTLIEQGVDAQYLNWRGMFASGKLTDEQRTELLRIVDETAKSEKWAETLVDRNWIDVYLPDAEFSAFIEEEKTRIGSVLTALGLVQ